MTQQRQRAGGTLKTQDALTAETIAAVHRFLEAVNRRDLDALAVAITDDCVHDSAFPLPDGTQYRGREAVRAYWQQVFRARPNAVSESEAMFAAGDRCVVQLVRRWTDDDGRPQHFRGVGLFRVRDGKVAEDLVYHKRNRSIEIQDTLTAATIATVKRFCEGFNRHDLDAVMAIMTDDCLMESLTPYPDGARYQGKAAVRARWEEVFHTYPDLRYETEEMFAVGDRSILRWVAHRTGKDGKPEHYRGIDIFRVRNGKLAEKLVYTKR